MAVAFSLLTSGSDTDGNSTVTTATVTAPASGVIFIGFDAYAGTPQAPSSISGLSGTWTSVRAVNTWAGNDAMFVWQGVGCTGSGAITITFPNNPDGVDFHVIGATGCNTTTPVVQSNGSSGTGSGTGFITASTTLSAFGSANNGVLCFACCGDYNGDPAVGTGFTELADTQRGSWGSNRYFSQYRADNDTTPDCQMGQNGSVDAWGFIALEVAAAATDSNAPRAAFYSMLRRNN